MNFKAVMDALDATAREIERDRILALIIQIENDWLSFGDEAKASAAAYLRRQIVDSVTHGQIQK